MMPELLRRVIANVGKVSEWLGDAAYMALYKLRAWLTRLLTPGDRCPFATPQPQLVL
jgi:hypothetical protein